MKKGVLIALLALAMLVTVAPAQMSPVPVSASSTEAGDVVAIVLHGQPFASERPPLLVDGVTLVPLRSIAEALGAAVSWDGATQTATLVKGSSEIRLTVGSNDAVKNGQMLRLEAPPRLIDSTTMVPLRFIGESLDTLVTWDGETRTVSIEPLPSLPVVGSPENLKALLLSAASARYSLDMTTMRVPAAGSFTVVDQSASSPASAGSVPPSAAPTAQTMSKATAESTAAAGSAGSAYSRTNTQVEGVDEADVVKTDGTYLYQVNKERIIVTTAVPSTEMSVASVISFDGRSFRPNELYVDDRHLIVIGSTNRPYAEGPVPAPAPAPLPTPRADTAPPAVRVDSKMMIAPIAPRQITVKAIVYDIADKSAPKQIREIELDGSYVSSRKIGSALYLVTNKYADISYIASNKEGIADTAKENAPVFKDSSAGTDYIPVDYSQIRYFPDFVEPNYMLIGGVNLSAPEQPMDVAAYLGSGQNIFASEHNLYAAVTKRQPISAQPLAPEIAPSNAPGTPLEKRMIAAPAYESKTTIYKFRLEQGKTKFVSQGEVPGTVLNQFSMDEHNGIFRIATTSGEMWRTDEHTSKNNLYTLNEALKPVGKLEGIAPGERIYSVRFMGSRAYMVTFKNVDPLFAIDLTNPAAPSIRGALKIPGYSDYLHPYDENHLIGFGKETVEVPVKGDPSNPERTMAYYQGMKISLFDVTDVSNPIEKFKEVIGGRGTQSELLNNHKALLFSKADNLLAFPVTVMEVPNKPATGGPESAFAYGQFTFQGAYVYRLDLTNGFDLKATITHMSEEERKKAGSAWYNSDSGVERIVYIGDTLYTLSKGMVKANDLLTFKEKSSLMLPK